MKRILCDLLHDIHNQGNDPPIIGIIILGTNQLLIIWLGSGRPQTKKESLYKKRKAVISYSEQKKQLLVIGSPSVYYIYFIYFVPLTWLVSQAKCFHQGYIKKDWDF